MVQDGAKILRYLLSFRSTEHNGVDTRILHYMNEAIRQANCAKTLVAIMVDKVTVYELQPSVELIAIIFRHVQVHV